MDFGSRAPHWPGGARCAVCISFDCDGESIVHAYHPEAPEHYISTLSFGRYEELAIPRIARAFEHLGIRQTFFVPAWCLHRYPHVFSALVDAGHELGLHGYIHESPIAQTPAGERHWFERAHELHRKLTGRDPLGYRAPDGHVTATSMELLAEYGVLYDSSLLNDDDPYVIATSKGDVIELPANYTLADDWSQYGHLPAVGALTSPRPVSTAVEVWRAEFEEAYRCGGMFVAVFHPMLSGRRSRLRGLVDFIAEMQGRGDVWFATLGEIAQHVKDAAQLEGSLVDRLDWPFDPPGPLPEFTDAHLGADLTLRVTRAPGT